MPNLETDYMGLKLRNPIIVGSSGLTKSVGKIVACEKAGAAAVVLKSLFEEAITMENYDWESATLSHSEAYEYLKAEINLQYGSHEYCEMIREVKKTVSIPVIASINCISANWWPEYARKIEMAGADALELNVFPMVSDLKTDSSSSEQQYIKILKSVKEVISIPVAMKISMYITSLPNLASELCRSGLNGLVLFNRFIEPDIDIDTLKIRTTFPITKDDNINHTLRWTSLLSGRIPCPISATGSIHSADSVIKLMLAGASTVQLASVLYTQGFKKIGEIINKIVVWLDEHQFKSLSQARGLLNFSLTESPDLYLRSQYLENIRRTE